MSAPVETPPGGLAVAPPVENPPAEVHEVAFVEDQKSCDDWPLSIVLGLAERRAVGVNKVQVGGLFAPFAQVDAETVTVTDCTGVVPPGPVHWKVKVVSAVSGSVSPFPESVPWFDHGPPAVQLVALVEPQVSVERLFGLTDVGEAESEAVGGAAETLTEHSAD